MIPPSDPAPPQPCHLIQGELIPYLRAWHWQQAIVTQLQQNPHHPDILALLQHPPVYTLGRGASLAYLGETWIPNPAPGPELGWIGGGYPVYRIERGGEITHHCPGQLVGYPLICLQRHHQDLHWYLRQIEEIIIQVLRQWDLEAERLPGLTGVWVQGYKVAAVGIKVSRWVTMHGFSLNVCPDLAGFAAIVPCGIRHRPVGTLAQFVPHISMDTIRQQIAATFAQHLGWCYLPPLSWRPTDSQDPLLAPRNDPKT